MKNPILLLTILLIIIAGCSTESGSPVVPSQDTSMTTPRIDSTSETLILGSGTMNLEKGTVEFDNRVLDPYYNITGILGSNFSYTINGLIPPDTWDITLRINNISTTTAYDVVIVFERLYGKTVVNKDGWIDIYQPFDTDPIIAFRKEDPNRAFPPGTDTEQLLLKYPAGAGPLINFFILAHLPGNTGGVYDLYEWTQVGELTNDHGFATLSVKVKDWQNDVSAVYVDTRAFNG